MNDQAPPATDDADAPTPPPAVEPRPSAARRFNAVLKARMNPLMVLLLCATFFVGGMNVALRLLIAPPPPAGNCQAPTDEWALLCEAYDRIKANYVDEVPDEDLIEAAIRGMIDYGLEDPYSGYMPPAEYHGALDSLSGEFSGIGAEITVSPTEADDDEATCTVVSSECALTVVAPIAGSPAEAAGLASGDVITAVDGTPTDGLNATELSLRIRGEKGTEVTLDVLREGEELVFEITRDTIEISPVSTRMLTDEIGYLRLTSFTDESADEVATALDSLFDDGATSLVLDLRGNPGGYITAAQGVASQFIESGLIFTVEDGEGVEEWTATGDGAATDPSIEMVVLIDGGSASASEIVAAALAEHDRALIVGTPSFGKDTVQTWQALTNDGGLRLTIARWYTPEHNLVGDSDGVQPDVVVDETPNGMDDPVIDAAVELLSE